MFLKPSLFVFTCLFGSHLSFQIKPFRPPGLNNNNNNNKNNHQYHSFTYTSSSTKINVLPIALPYIFPIILPTAAILIPQVI